MCVASLLHTRLTLMQRAEIAVAGFVSLDIFRLLAAKRCSALALPTGSTFMSPQTLFNIQGVALSALVVTVTKEENWHPFSHGQCRLSELGVEEWFSLLRRQSSNAQLTTRGFFQASARTTMHHGKILNKLMPRSKTPEPPLTDEQSLGSMGWCFSDL